MKNLKLFEVFVSDTTTLNDNLKKYYDSLKFKIGDIVELNDKYFIDMKKRSSVQFGDLYEDSDDILTESIFNIIFVNLKDKNDIIETVFISDIYTKQNNAGWVDIDQIEFCPEWKQTANKYNL